MFVVASLVVLLLSRPVLGQQEAPLECSGGYCHPTDVAQLQEFLGRMTSLSMSGTGDSDGHLLTLFSTALGTKGSTFVELGVRHGATTEPLLWAAHLNGGLLHSVDVLPTQYQPDEKLQNSWRFYQRNATSFLKEWPLKKKIDFVYIDDWHSYDHVKEELALIDPRVGPSSLILIHDLMYGNHEPFYHSDMHVKDGQWANGGPYRAVGELDTNFWEWATLPWNNGMTLLRKKYSSKFHPL